MFHRFIFHVLTSFQQLELGANDLQLTTQYFCSNWIVYLRLFPQFAQKKETTNGLWDFNPYIPVLISSEAIRQSNIYPVIKGFLLISPPPSFHMCDAKYYKIEAAWDQRGLQSGHSVTSDIRSVLGVRRQTAKSLTLVTGVKSLQCVSGCWERELTAILGYPVCYVRLKKGPLLYEIPESLSVAFIAAKQWHRLYSNSTRWSFPHHSGLERWWNQEQFVTGRVIKGFIMCNISAC